MKFLITTTPRRLQMPSVAMIEAAKAWIHARLADGTFDCCYGFMSGGGVTICNAESPDKVAQLLTDYPAYMGADWKVDALCDISKSLDNVVTMIKRTAG